MKQSDILARVNQVDRAMVERCLKLERDVEVLKVRQQYLERLLEGVVHAMAACIQPNRVAAAASPIAPPDNSTGGRPS